MSGRAGTRPRAPLRRGRDAVLAAVGAAVLVLAALPVERTSVPAAEAAVFRTVDGVGMLPSVPVRPVVQLGHVLVVPAGALVAAALLPVARPGLGRRGRIAPVVVATAVCLPPVHVAAHLPLDVAAGAGLGLLVGSPVLLVTGRPR